MMLGDMALVGNPPARLTKALAVIAEGLHSSFDADSSIVPGKSKQSCILASLACRDFLKRIGFKDAACRSVCFAIRAMKDGQDVHSVGAGHPDQSANGSGWDGHLVVVTSGYVIDATVYQVRRQHWPSLPGMFAVPINDAELAPVWGLPVLAGVEARDAETGNNVDMIWLDKRDGSWRHAPDYERQRRAAVVGTLVKMFGQWKG